MKWNHWFGIVIAAISTFGLVISFIPSKQTTARISFSSLDQIEGSLKLTQPDSIIIGDSAQILLDISITKNLTNSPSIVFLSKLEMDNLSISPKGEGEVVSDPSKPLVLIWQVKPFKTATYNGTLWLFHKTSDGHKALILSRPITLSVKDLWGVSKKAMRYFSIFGQFLAVVFLFGSNIKRMKVK